MTTGNGGTGTRRIQDPRIDALIKWALGAIFALAVTLISWFISDVRSAQEQLEKKVWQLEKEHAVFKQREAEHERSNEAQWRAIRSVMKPAGPK